MAASVGKKSKMCLHCFLRIGLQTRFLGSRVLSSTSVPRLPLVYNEQNGTSHINRGWMVVHQRQMSVIYYLIKNYEKSRKNRRKEPRPKFTMRYGLEGAIARELISFGANVHFSNGKWYGRKTLKSWKVSNPGPEATDFTINAVDAKDSFVNQGAIENMAKTLENVKYLNLDGCKYVDDHCLASLVHMRHSLTHLSVNRCNQITDGGLANLHRLRKLERLNMNDLPLVVNAKLVAILLEDHIPKLRIGMVTEQIEEYKEKMKLLEDPDHSVAAIDDKAKANTAETSTNRTAVNDEEETLKAAEIVNAEQIATASKEKNASSDWTDLIHEKPQRT